MENKLEHLKRFQKILSDYHVSDESKDILKETKLVLLISATAGGRNTIIQELVETGRYHYIISDTTRNKRANNGIPEQDGREYWFRSEEEILADLSSGKFLEAAIIHYQHVSGISIRELLKARDEHKIAISEIEIVGMHNIIAAKPDAIAIFVLPPSFEEWMKRLDGRGHMSVEEKKRRLSSAVVEFSAALEHDYYKFVINDTVAHAVEQIEAITTGKQNISQKEAHQLAERLLTDTKAYLKTN